MKDGTLKLYKRLYYVIQVHYVVSYGALRRLRVVTSRARRRAGRFLATFVTLGKNSPTEPPNGRSAEPDQIASSLPAQLVVSKLRVSNLTQCSVARHRFDRTTWHRDMAPSPRATRYARVPTSVPSPRSLSPGTRDGHADASDKCSELYYGVAARRSDLRESDPRAIPADPDTLPSRLANRRKPRRASPAAASP